MKLFYCLIICLFYTAASANVLITFAGDLNASVIPQDKKGSSKIFKSVRTIIQKDDLTIANLECTISNRGKKAEDKLFTFRAKPAIAGILHDNGIDAVTIANNHSLDFGTDAFFDTLKNLKSAKINFAGGGINSTKTTPSKIKIKDTNVTLFAASRVLPNARWMATKKRPGLVSAYNPEKLLADIKNARKDKTQLIISYIHWGVEKETATNKIQRKLAHQLIDAGADVVIGSHPHVLQGFEWYKGKLIVYSLGNFIFSSTSRLTMMVQLKVDKNKIVGVKVIPLQLANKTPQIIKEDKDKKKLYKYLSELSLNASVDDKGYIIQNKSIPHK